jgi:hypothetical protein
VVSEMVEAAPEDDRAGFPVSGAGEEATEVGDPADGLA